MIEIYQMLAWS